VGAYAGEQIALWCLVIQERIGLSKVAQAILPYPTRSEAGKRTAGSHYTERLFSAGTRRLVNVLRWFG
jgi:hypothetical protein